MNWCFNVYPLLHPALSNVYDKLRFKTNPSDTMWVNNVVQANLHWALQKIKNSCGLFLLKSVAWLSTNATYTIYCDACLTRIGFWYLTLDLAFYSSTPHDDLQGLTNSKGTIFYFEALCVLCMLHDVCAYQPGETGRFVIYTDNLNTVDIFSSLSALPSYNVLLHEAVDLLYGGDHSLRVLHVKTTKLQMHCLVLT